MTRRQAGVFLALAHVALVGSLGAKLLADRARLPRGWARTAPFDPSTPLRGRYVRLAVEVPVAGVTDPAVSYATYGVRLRVLNGKVVGDVDSTSHAPRVQLQPRDGSAPSRLSEPVAFFIPERVADPSIRPPGEELWVELTLPRGGWPRPIRLGVLHDGELTPLELR